MLKNNAAVTASGTVGLTWSFVGFNYGSPIIDYEISYMPVLGTYSILSSGVTTTSYTTTLATLTADVVYTFKVKARNSFGFSSDSSEVVIRAAAVPGAPASPATSVNGNTNVIISWAAPADNGGSPITGFNYLVKIRQSDGITFTTEASYCNVLLSTCSVPISVLQAAPYNLAWGDSIYATVAA